MKSILLFSLLIISSCISREESPNDDYVLIEFASKLEEEAQKLNLSQQPNQSEKTSRQP